MTRDELIQIIRRESADLASGVDAAQAAATIMWASSNLLDILDPFGNVSARTVAHNGTLTDRYAGKE